MRIRYELLNYLIQVRGYTSYLEIGVDDPRLNFNKVRAPHRFGVDPACKFVNEIGFHGTSDDFFELNNGLLIFDIIFIDGLHEAGQVYRDIENSFSILGLGGVIVLHDCLPKSEAEQIVPRKQEKWKGDVWKAFVRYREKNPKVSMCTVDIDCGMGILEKSNENCPFKAGKELTYTNFVSNCKEWMNVVSIDEFLNGNLNN